MANIMLLEQNTSADSALLSEEFNFCPTNNKILDSSWLQSFDDDTASLYNDNSAVYSQSFNVPPVMKHQRAGVMNRRDSFSPVSHNLSIESTNSSFYTPLNSTMTSTSPNSSFSQVNREGKNSRNAQAIPSGIPYPGHCGFQIGFEAQQKDTKAMNWTYSQSLRKLFVRMSSSCPVKFRTTVAPPPGSIIRATPVYLRPEHVQEVVHRCPNHATAKEFNDNHPAPMHLVRCEHSVAKYCEDASSKRHSVIVPCEQPQAGSQWVTNLYQFMCFSSCVGGLNRRPIQVVFTLESHQGQLLGRQSVEVRICACPGRDKKVEENAAFPKPKPVKRQHSSSSGGDILAAAAKKVKLNGTDTEEFKLVIRGRENFEILSRLRDSLELASFLPKDVLSQFTS